MWSSRTFLMLSASNSYVCWPIVANRTVFVFFTCNINGWGQLMLFPIGRSWFRSFTLYLRYIWIAVWFFDTWKPRGTLALSSAEKKNTFSCENKDASSLTCFMEAIAMWQSTCFFGVCLKLGKLNWNNLDMLLLIAMSCILWKHPEKNWTLAVNAM